VYTTVNDSNEGRAGPGRAARRRWLIVLLWTTYCTSVLML